MAHTSVRLREPWEREVKAIHDSRRMQYVNRDHALFVVHPGADPSEGNPSQSARAGIQRELEMAVRNDQRVTLIYPLRGGAYIDPIGVTDVRGGDDEHRWVQYGDVQEPSLITLVGGKLRQCMGSLYQSLLFSRGFERERLAVRLPPDAIYTNEDYTAEQEFLSGVSVIGELPSLCTLFASPGFSLIVYHKSQLEYGYFSSEHPMRVTNLHLNGKRVASFGKSHELVEESALPPTSAKRRSFMPLPPLPPRPQLTIDLYVESGVSTSPNSTLATAVQGRWAALEKTIAPHIR